MTSPSSLLLLNCTRCDDVLKLVDTVRICECGGARGKIDAKGDPEALGSCRVLSITWEAYDGIQEGEPRPFTVLPRAQSRGRGP
jgi:hypothetical protein